MAAFPESYYDLLGVSKTATTEEIKAAWRPLAKKLHPDRNKEPDAEEKFKRARRAYGVLTDDRARRRYDSMEETKPGSAEGMDKNDLNNPVPNTVYTPRDEPTYTASSDEVFGRREYTPEYLDRFGARPFQFKSRIGSDLRSFGMRR